METSFQNILFYKLIIKYLQQSVFIFWLRILTPMNNNGYIIIVFGNLFALLMTTMVKSISIFENNLKSLLL